jgi:hypothetical protein
MSLIKKFLIPTLLLCSFSNVKSQIYLQENFEQIITNQWSAEYIDGSDVIWINNAGGHEFESVKSPPIAKQGTFNAYFFQSTVEVKQTRLYTTTPIDLSFAEKPRLSLWYAQMEWGEGFYEKLRIQIRNGSDGDWVTIGEYVDPTIDWEQIILFIPDSLLHEETYLGFLGETGFGHGLCLDSIVFEETGIIPYQITHTEYNQATTKFVAAGTNHNPIVSLRLNAYGNVGALKLKRLAYNSAVSNHSTLASNPAGLYSTSRPYFNTNNQLGSNVAVNDSIVFTGLDHALGFGSNYFWLSLNVAENAKYGETIDAHFRGNGIEVMVDTTGFSQYSSVWVDGNQIYYVIENDTLSTPMSYTFPAAQTETDGYRTIKDKVFLDDFEGSVNWTLGGDFEIDQPLGLGANDLKGNPDPEEAFEGTKVLGTDLTGLGANPGDYENNSGPYYATLNIQDAFYYNDLHVAYFQWINQQSTDNGKLEFSADSGATWQDVIPNFGNITQDFWTYDTVNIGVLGANKKKNVSVRFTINGTNSSAVYSGINIDNFVIAGNFIERDLGIVQIDAPFDKCGHTSSDSITVWIRNFAGLPLNDTLPVPIYYSLDGGTNKTYDTIYLNLGLEDSARVTLNVTANLLSPDIYSIIVGTDLQDDEGPDNNETIKTFYAFPTYTPGYTEQFEIDEGVWKAYGQNVSWQHGNFTGIMNGPPSGDRGWATQIATNYYNADSSYLETGCYDFTSAERTLVEFYYYMNTETNVDGFNLQYSIDEGSTWQLVDTNDMGWDWGWFNDSVSAIDDIGWSGNNGGWTVVRELLPASISSESDVKFRIHFASDTINNAIGVGIDNFKVYESPKDVGVESITSHNDTCQYANPTSFTVSIRNYGLNTLDSGDSIIVGFDVTRDAYSESDIDTFYLSTDLAPGASVDFDFTTSVDNVTPGFYTATAYTLYEADPWFYLGNNDSSTLVYEIKPNPLAIALDTISTKEPDTVVIRPHYDVNYTYLWEDLSTADTFDVPEQGVYYLTVTDFGGNKCFTVDSIYIELLFNDGGVDSLISPQSNCENGTQYITVQFRNFGTDSLPAGEPISILYELNDGIPIQDDFILPETVKRGNAIPLTFETGAIDFSVEALYKLKIYADVGGDTIPSNDTVVSYVQTYGYPSLDLGADQTLEAYSYTFNPPPGFVSYLWDDGDTNRIHVIDTSDASGLRTLQVVDTNNCGTSDTVFIRLINRDIQPISLISPISSCEISEATPLSINAYNNGNDTIFAGQKVFYSYQINSNARVLDSVSLTSQWLPGDTLEHEFEIEEDFSLSDDYAINITASSYRDLTVVNDTILANVRIDANPGVDFGLDTNFYSIFAYEYTLEPGNNDAWLYTWIRGVDTIISSDTISSYTTSQSSFYKVIAVDTLTGCVGSDEISLAIYVRDFTIVGSNLPGLLCSEREIEPELIIRHNGNFNIQSGEIDLHYGTSQDSFNETYVFNSQFRIGAYDTIKLNNTFNIGSPGNTSAFFAINYEGDMNTANDSISDNYTIVQSPSVEIEDSDTISTSTLPIAIEASGNFVTYRWHDNYLGNPYQVNNDGWQ